MAEPTEADRERADDVARRILNGYLMQSAVRAVIAQELADEREKAYWTVMEAGDVWVSRDKRARPAVVVDFLVDLATDVRLGRQFRHPAFTIAAEETGQ